MATQTLPELSPSALNRFLGCEHRTYLDILDRRGTPVAERRPPNMQLLFERGDRHEQEVLDGLREEGRDVVSLVDETADRPTLAARTLAAMRAGREVIHQGCFLREGWVGFPDFLVRIDEPSDLGPWAYEVHDAKLSRHPQPRHVFQLLFYTDALERLQGVRPARMHLMLGDGEHPGLHPDEFAAYAARIRAAFAARHEELAAPEPDPPPAYPYRVAACDFCPWWQHCEARRHADDHVSLVAGVFRSQGLKLEAAGITTVAGLAQAPADLAVARLPAATLATMRAQAGLQHRSRGLARPLFELLAPDHDRGLGRLPEPSPGDVFFDFEGDQYWGDEGLEYLFGTVFADGAGAWTYRPLWALDRAGERVAFEAWMDWTCARLAEHPGLHVFHYNAYEVTALKALVARHATREHELDELLRRRVFVDLYGITRQAIRAGTEGYGLKALEPVFGFERDAELRGAVGSMRRWQQFQEDGSRAHLDEIAAYNEDDCHSTRALYAWLLARRPEAERQFGVRLASLAPEPPKEPNERQKLVRARTEAVRGPLLAGLPDDPSHDDPEQRARRTAFHLLGYHAREAKPAFWALFARRERTPEQLRDEDGEAIAGLEVLATEDLGTAWRWTLSYPAQDHKLGPGDADEPLAERSARIESLDEAARTLVVRRSKARGDDPPGALGPGWPYGTREQEDALFRLAERVAARGLEPRGELDAATDLLLRRPPRLRPGTPALGDDAVDLPRLRAQVRGLHDSALVVQGPPGTGKTWTGARLALDLMAGGRRVGVMATSHKAINHFVRAVEEAADEAGTTFRGWKKQSDPDNDYASDRVQCSRAPDEEDGPVLLHASTAWHWAREDARESVDVLFVDEAGQVALGDALAVAQAARSVVLLGDPQQLAHVSQGTHPLGAGLSVLEHVLDGRATIPPDRGAFLGTSWRMHPDVCGFVSRTMYDGRLTSVAGTERRRIDSPGLSGSGLRLLPVSHEDNRGRSAEEADAVAAEVARLLDGGTWVDRDGKRHTLTLDDILVVAPYNAQVRCLAARLPEGARIGTVDRFQGQEAPVVLFSMASSRGDDVARGMRFLFSRNRLNVAVSRAQALAVVVCSPALLSARCATVEDMQLVNMLCRFADEAGGAPAALPA